MTKNRLEAFSDGVFAIVITLLILDVRFPADKPLTLETLWGVAPHLWAFVLSFVIVGVYWVSHHNMLHFIRAVDRQLLWLNLALLLIVVFIPFPAALLGQHSDNELAVALYGINLMLVNAAGAAMWLYATSRPHLAADGMTPALSRFVAKLHSAPILGVRGRDCAGALVRAAGSHFVCRRAGVFHPAQRIHRSALAIGDGGASHA